MAFQAGFTEQSGSTLAHQAFVVAVKDMAVASGWEVVRHKTDSAEYELILKGPGYTGSEEIFVGLKTFQNVEADYYNLLAGVFLGYAPSEDFDHQPGAALKTIPCHNQRVDYWLTVNPQRIAFCCKVGTPVYTHGYLGKFLPYAMPHQYPYPCVCGGMHDGRAEIRFSDPINAMYLWGRKIDAYDKLVRKSPLACCTPGGWTNNLFAWPYLHRQVKQRLCFKMRDSGGVYHLLPIELCDEHNIYGSLDGLYYVCGFENAVENTVNVGGKNYIVLQDWSRTTHASYYAMEMI